jgi:NAD(P)-dependent dehydrogenase (short-subunit alcohol dehydrogenase family)
MIRGSAFAVRMDVTDQESIDGAVSEVTSRVGGFDILVSNAAAVFDLAPIFEITWELQSIVCH